MDALARKFAKPIFFGLLTLIYTRRIPLDFHVLYLPRVCDLFGALVIVSANHSVLRQFFYCRRICLTLARRLRTFRMPLNVNYPGPFGEPVGKLVVRL